MIIVYPFRPLPLSQLYNNCDTLSICIRTLWLYLVHFIRFRKPIIAHTAKMELSSVLNKLKRREDLTDVEATFAVQHITSAAAVANPVATGVLLALLAAKGEGATEVAAFAKHMRHEAVCVAVPVRCIMF